MHFTSSSSSRPLHLYKTLDEKLKGEVKQYFQMLEQEEDDLFKINK